MLVQEQRFFDTCAFVDIDIQHVFLVPDGCIHADSQHMTCINQFGVIEHFFGASVEPKHQVWASTDSEVVIFVEIVEMIDTVSNNVISKAAVDTNQRIQ
jgi:hypothetical protein